MTTSNFDPNDVLLTGENPFIRLSEEDDGPVTTNASLWRIILSPGGPGHVLFLRSDDLTDGEVQVYSDNIAMTRWLQSTVQGSLDAAFGDTSLPVIEAEFERTGDVRSFWTERVTTLDEDISLTWYDFGQPLLLHTQPNASPERPYGVCTLFVPAAGSRLSVDGIQAPGRPWPRERDGKPFSTCALAFSESWTAAPATQ